MNRRRFLGSIAVITAAIGVTRVPDSAQADPLAPSDDAVSADWCDGYDIGKRHGFGEAVQMSAPEAVVAGAFYDFMGRITSLEEPITVGREHTVYAILDAFTAWAGERGLDIQGADVLGWQNRLNGDESPSIAQARADGYNRGREVEAARLESRLHIGEYQR